MVLYGTIMNSSSKKQGINQEVKFYFDILL